MESSISQEACYVKSSLTRKSPSVLQDLWSSAREGSIQDVEAALLKLKKTNGNVDSKNAFGLTALHIAVWRNHVPIVRRLLAAGADSNIKDGESGWSSLHRALHFGHLAVAGVLIDAGASLTLEDSKGQIPADYLSGPLRKVVFGEKNKDWPSRDEQVNANWYTELFSWGNGANYQLGTGNARIQKLPCKVEEVEGLIVKQISAAKFHSIALTDSGDVYTWGFGRGGRLGHPDFDVHSGQAAVITPRQVSVGLGQRRVKVVAAAKHHTIAATFGGDVFTWGTNREGQLGYTSVDTQPTPRRVSLLRAKVISVAAANKHSAAVTDSGDVFTWGCNKEGQLGYGTCNSASNYVPRIVESLKGKSLVEVSTAKHHTVALGTDGEVFQWGFKIVTPRRVIIQRNTKKGGNLPLRFHCMGKLHVIKIAAGWTHSTALTDDGTIFYWVSSDPNLHCQQLYCPTDSTAVAISSGKVCTSFVTSTGDVYAWDGKKNSDNSPIIQRIHGIKHAISVSVGYKHFLAVSAIYSPQYTSKYVIDAKTEKEEKDDLVHSSEEDDMIDTVQKEPEGSNCVNKFPKALPSLKDLCQKVAAESLLNAKNAIHLLDVADMLEAEDLQRHCEDFVLHNLDYIITISPTALSSVSPLLLSKLEKSLDAKSSESWSHRHLPTQTATFPVVVDSEEDDIGVAVPRLCNNVSADITDGTADKKKPGDGFLLGKSAAEHNKAKQARAIKKKLQQIEMLELRQRRGHHLDEQQKAKLESKYLLLSRLSYLETGEREFSESNSITHSVDGKSIEEMGSRHRKKGKKKGKKTGSREEDVDSSIPRINLSPSVDFHAKELEIISPKSMESCQDASNGGGSTNSGDADVPVSMGKANSHVKSLTGNENTGMQNVTQSSKKSMKKKSKKGGLSVFLSGALDEVPKVVDPSPPPVKAEGPAWGGVKIMRESLSLLEIQSEQIGQSNALSLSQANKESSACMSKLKSQNSKSARKQKNMADPRETKFNEHETEHRCVHASAPIMIAPKKDVTSSDVERNTPPWAGSLSTASKSSLRDIQMQQVKYKRNSLPNFNSKSPVDAYVSGLKESPKENPSRWFKPDTVTPSSIRCIQIEEKAMKDLRRHYKHVKLVQRDS
eukprot:TRINITY_DN4353_c0_g1_i1.p1 TRINITY_DN4353_c0_g1~~TRINITY_DN4353_c0_g1_i1.p1  ORF type:complete len:1124 (+),score=296.88 TRINITY_DN4353_c0_g1_i1:577-3948(+)